jgi:transposase InsO family protein
LAHILRNHASTIVACDFCIAVTATFRLFYVLVVIEHGSRRLLHCNVTEHPTAEWTLQQLREAVPCEHQYRFLIHGRIVKEWVAHYNRSRPHAALGPSVPDPPLGIPVSIGYERHRIADKLKVISTPILGGLHHEYAVVPA